jgi:hypothetical protein
MRECWNIYEILEENSRKKKEESSYGNCACIAVAQ